MLKSSYIGTTLHVAANSKHKEVRSTSHCHRQCLPTQALRHAGHHRSCSAVSIDVSIHNQTYLNGQEDAHGGSPAQVTSIGALYGFKSQCVHSVPGHWILTSVIYVERRHRMPGCVNRPTGGNPGARHLWPAAVQGMGAGRWAHGEMVVHPLNIREALGSIPRVSTLGHDASPV